MNSSWSAVKVIPSVYRISNEVKGHESGSEFKNKFNEDCVFISSELDSGSNSIVGAALGVVLMLRVGELHSAAAVSKVYMIVFSLFSVMN